MEWLEGVGWGESCFLDEGNQNCVFLEEVLELLEGILDAISIELEDVAGRRWRGWRDKRLRLWNGWWRRR